MPAASSRIVRSSFVSTPRPNRTTLARVSASCVLALVLPACVVAPMAPPPPPMPPPVMSPQGRAPGVPFAPSAATPMYFHPERGQPEAQQDRDRYECYRWAVRESGTDPGMTPVRQSVPLPPSAPPPAAARDGSAVLAGAATGAVLGAAVSSPRQAGTNAVIGAIFGAALGASAQEARAQSLEQAQARRQEAAAAAAAAPLPLDPFRRAMSACMQGRGYRIA